MEAEEVEQVMLLVRQQEVLAAVELAVLFNQQDLQEQQTLAVAAEQVAVFITELLVAAEQTHQ